MVEEVGTARCLVVKRIREIYGIPETRGLELCGQSSRCTELIRLHTADFPCRELSCIPPCTSLVHSVGNARGRTCNTTGHPTSRALTPCRYVRDGGWPSCRSQTDPHESQEKAPPEPGTKSRISIGPWKSTQSNSKPEDLRSSVKGVES